MSVLCDLVLLYQQLVCRPLYVSDLLQGHVSHVYLDAAFIVIAVQQSLRSVGRLPLGSRQ